VEHNNPRLLDELRLLLCMWFFRAILAIVPKNEEGFIIIRAIKACVLATRILMEKAKAS